MKKISVTVENCEWVAAELVGALFGKQLVIASYMDRKPLDLRILSGLVLVSGFTFQGGCLTIPLSPIRTISWNVYKEKVTLTYRSDDSVELVRVISENQTLFRIIQELKLISPA